MKNEGLNFYFGTTGFSTEYDKMDFAELLKKILYANCLEAEDGGFLQAFQNKFSRKLSVPTIRLVYEDINYAGTFSSERRKRFTNNVKIKISPDNDITETMFVIPHEVKHSEQEYILHKFCNFGVVPRDDLGKAILIINLLGNKSKDDSDYYSRLEELDALIFEVDEMSKLINKYPHLFYLDFQLYLRSSMFIILEDLKYNYEGINNRGIRQSMNRLRGDIAQALGGEYGKSVQNAVQSIVQSGFNLEKAYSSITSKLDKWVSWIVLENQTFKRLGAEDLELAINGHLNYAPIDSAVDGCYIDEFSEYARFINKFVCKYDGELEEMNP